MKYMGLSPKHASSVPLVLNPSTGYLSPQFHAVFDNWFATVSATADQLPDFTSNEWAKMFGESSYQYPLDDDDLAELQSSTADMDQADATAAARSDAHRQYDPTLVKPLASARGRRFWYPKPISRRRRRRRRRKVYSGKF